MKHIFLSLLLFVGSVSFSMLQAQEKAAVTGIAFNHITLAEALKQAAQTNKLVFIDCYTSWCGPCKMLSTEVFPQKEVGDFYNANFICIKMDMEKGEGPDIARKYQVKSYPTLLFLNAKGEIEHRDVGSRNAKGIIELGKVAMTPSLNSRGLSERLKMGDNSFETISMALKMTRYGSENTRDSLLNLYFHDKSREFWFDKKSIQLIGDYSSIASKFGKFVLQNESELKEKVGKEIVESWIERLISQFYTVDYKLMDMSRFGAKKYLDSIGHPLVNKFFLHNKLYNCVTNVRNSPDDTANWTGLLDVSQKLMDRYGNREKSGIVSNLSYCSEVFKNDIPDICAIIQNTHHRLAPLFITCLKFGVFKNHLKPDSLIGKADIDYIKANYKNFAGDTVIGNMTINNLAWDMVKHPKRNELLEAAKALSAGTIINSHNYYFFDTYATICAQMGQFDEAVKNQEIAVQLVKEKAPEKLNFYTDCLEKFKNKKTFF